MIIPELSCAKLLRYLSSSPGLMALSIMAITPQDVANRAGDAARNILGALPGVASDVAGDYIKFGTPPSIIPNIGLGLARQACRRYADNPGALPGSVAAGLEDVCRPYLDDIGYGLPPGLELPFRGGQCYGLVYNLTFTANGVSGEPQSSEQIISGRIIGTDVRQNPAQGTQTAGILRQLNPGSPIDFIGLQSKFANGPSDPSITNLRRNDNGPDNCGNPPPLLTDPVPPVNPGPGVEPYNPAPGIDIDIDLTFGPEGDITFNIGTGPITIDPFGDGGGGGGGGDNPGIDQPGTAPSSGLPPGDIGEAAPPADTGEDGVASGCAPPNSVLVGIKIVILEPLPEVSEYDPLVRRGVCYAYMGTPGNLALNPEGVALRSGQMLFAPLDNLTCYEVRANTGYNLRVTPYYRALEIQEV